MPTVHYRFIYPPIPIRNFDWEATFDEYDMGDPIGFGRTKEEALKNLMEEKELRQ